MQQIENAPKKKWKKMILDIPTDLKLDIIRRAAREGFVHLRPFIAAGNETKNLVFTREVLEETGVDEFMVFGSMAREESIYRPFLLKCVQAGNVQAKYIEGVRLLREHGENEQGFQLLSEASELFINAKFAVGIFLLCAGAFEEGMGTVVDMWDIVPNLDQGVQIADFVVQQIASMGIEPKSVFRKTLQYPWIMWCVYTSCTPDDVCKDCFAYWYAQIFCSLC